MDKQQLFAECIRILQITPIRRNPEELNHLLIFALTITFFRELGEQSPEMLQRCIQVLSYRTIKSGDILFKVGDSGSLFYVILRGSVGINIRLPNPDDSQQFELKEVNILKAGASFGELALINDAKRTATIVAKEDCVFAVMEKHHYKSILGAQEIAKIQNKISFLCSFPFFSSWSFREIKTISYHFEPVTVTLNQAIIKQNEYCNHFYVVRDGEFQVQFSYKNKLCSICTLGPGESFGQEAFLSKEGQFLIKSSIFVQWGKTKYDIVCKSEIGVAYKITREDIQKRFWDSKTQVVFLQLLSSIHHFRSIKAEELIKEIDNKRKKLDEQIHLPIPLKKSYVQKYNLLSSRNTNDDILKDKQYDEFKQQEKQAIEQFTKLLKDRNCSYAQVKTFFDQKKFVSQGYFKKRFYHKQFFRFASNNSQFRKSANEQELEQMNGMLTQCCNQQNELNINNSQQFNHHKTLSSPTTMGKFIKRIKLKVATHQKNEDTQTIINIRTHSPNSYRSMNSRRMKTYID
ncbi:unnamed protein product (macronuclear) [Paramecium tetraurelia]|uniref:Cyclic nucleotide-binding domain-containing protein n=1 Tax=Paramecium tetraurelia TaxID=5888 RepID=A0CCD0_PARTE|nr:uncharacterized protein GSPATT00037232001 [Paramecium tetraurelia]CAK68447.1 unnamed protein product [Paramecium tetraurelia]|eukprot:XP_001435844.1 hypothetical protein (macronuclear) [Paramecium tetraurelia strain d4-2]